MSLLLCRQHLHAQLADAEVHVRMIGLGAASANRSSVVLEPIGDTGGAYVTNPGPGGDAIFSHVPPGSYRLIVSLSASEVIHESLDIFPADVLLITVAAGGSQPVSGRAVEVRRHRFSYDSVFDDVRLRDLPTSASLWPLIETAEPLTFSDRIDTGGLSAGAPALVGSHASSWTQTSFQVDGIDVTDLTRGGTPLLYPDLDAFTAVNVTSGAMPVEIGPGGPAVTLVPRRPTNRWIAEVSGEWTPNAGDAPREVSGVPVIASLTSWSKGHALVSGPLIGNRMGVLVSSTFIRSGRQDKNSPADVAGDVDSVLAHLTVTPAGPYELRVIAGGQRLTRPFAGRALYQAGSATEGDRQLQLQATWTGRPGTGAPWRIAGAYQRSDVTPRLAGLTRTNAIERLRDGPVPELASATAGIRQRWTTSAGFEPKLVEHGRAHHLRLGVTLSNAVATARPDPPGLIPELVAGLPARVWDYHYAGPVSEWRETILSGYAADRFIPSDRIALETGVRFETVRGSADGAPDGVAWTSVSPRLSVRWRPSASERVTIVGGYGRYQWQWPLLNLAFGDETAARGTVYRWLDDGDQILQPSEIGPLIARVGPGSSGAQTAIDPGLRRPYTDEFVAGVESRPARSLLVRFTGIARRDRRLAASVNVGVPLSGYEIGVIPDPGGDLLGPEDDQLLPFYNRLPSSFGEDREVLTSPPGLNATFEGLELTIDKTLTNRFQLLFGATATRSEGPGANRGFHVLENDQGLIGELLTNPNAATFSRNRLFFERGYSIKVSGSYHAPGDVRLGAAARYQDGQNFARMVIVPQLNQGPEAIQAYPNGRTRFTYALTLDVRAEKRITLRSINVGAVFEAYNLLNMANEVEEDTVTGPGFRTTTAVQPRRVFRAGLRIHF